MLIPIEPIQASAPPDCVAWFDMNPLPEPYPPIAPSSRHNAPPKAATFPVNSVSVSPPPVAFQSIAPPLYLATLFMNEELKIELFDEPPPMYIAPP